MGLQGLPFAFQSCAEVVNAAAVNCLSLKLGMMSHKTLSWIFIFLFFFPFTKKALISFWFKQRSFRCLASVACLTNNPNPLRLGVTVECY